MNLFKHWKHMLICIFLFILEFFFCKKIFFYKIFLFSCRDLRNCIDRLLTLCADDENFTSADDTVSVISVSECSGRGFLIKKNFLENFSQRF